MRALIGRLLAQRLDDLPSADELKDPKTRLQEYLQRYRRTPPDYEVVEITGADHARRFTVRCRVAELDIERSATGTSRRKAEQQAASDCLAELLAGAEAPARR
ncbi:MAG: putative dsRNA-binding protein [Halofilum sp. (in: g-proteobacteria)]|nr:putative dsRNA-binding protein [Halofilum sp. (in: g-proteobacteria)]